MTKARFRARVNGQDSTRGQVQLRHQKLLKQDKGKGQNRFLEFKDEVLRARSAIY